MDISHFLDSLLLLDTLPELDDVGVEPVVLGSTLEMVNVGEQILVVCERHTLQGVDSVAAHL